MLKRTQIVSMTTKIAARVASNEIGVAPVSKKHVKRLAELKAKAKETDKYTKELFAEAALLRRVG